MRLENDFSHICTLCIKINFKYVTIKIGFNIDVYVFSIIISYFNIYTNKLKIIFI